MLGPVGIGVGLWQRGGANPAAAFGTLIAAYEADYGITLNGGTVSAWAPRWYKSGLSPATLAWVQATAINQPDYIANRGDGKAEVRFNGSSQSMRCDALAAAYSGSTEAAMIMSWRFSTSVGSRSFLFGDATISDRDPFITTAAGPVMNMQVYETVTPASTTVSHTVNPGRYETVTFERRLTQLRREDDTGAVTGAWGGYPVYVEEAHLGQVGGVYAPIGVSALYIYRSKLNDGARLFVKQRWPNYG